MVKKILMFALMVVLEVTTIIYSQEKKFEEILRFHTS